MDQKKQTPGQQNQNQPGQGGKPNQGGSSQGDNEKFNQNNRDQAEGSRDTVNLGNRNQGNHADERGTGNAGERNQGGISNRGMDRSTEQRELPERGSRRDSDR